MSATSSTDAATEAARELAAALLNPLPASHFPAIGTEQMAAIKHLAAIFNVVTYPAPATTIPPESPFAPTFSPSPTTSLPTPPPPFACELRFKSRQLRAQVLPPAATRLQSIGIAPIVPSPRGGAVAVTTTPPPRIPLPPASTPVLPPRVPLSLIAPVPRVEYTWAKLKPAPPPTPFALPNTTPHLIPLDRTDSPFEKTMKPRATHLNNPFGSMRGQYIAATTHILQSEALANAIVDDATGISLEYGALSCGPDKNKWIRALGNDSGRLAQGVIPVKFPKAARSHICVLFPPFGQKKVEQTRVRITIGGDRLDYHGSTTTCMASLTTTTYFLNSVLFTPNTCLMTANIANFYYPTPLDIYENAQLPLKLIPHKIVDEYNLIDLAVNGIIYIEICKGMLGLKQAGKLANNCLTTHLAQHRYHPVPRTPSLWKYETNSVFFTLVVDDFGIKYTEKADVDHLIQALKINMI